MSSGNLLSIQPTDDLKFSFELNKQTSWSSTLQLTNKSNEYVAFKVNTTDPKKYRVRPNTVIILPTCEVTVSMQAHKETPLDMLQCKDKFLVQSTVIQAPTTGKGDDITPETFNKQSGNVVEEFKFRVIYVVPVANNTPVLAAGSSPPPPRASSLPYAKKKNESQHIPELKFPFQLNKQSSCTLDLAN
ncbi:hypothetical protein MKW92_052046 [Papaver armeniacum]|nr:hypothetical protein MKW92_052046 [Papaver armeniacum]